MYEAQIDFNSEEDSSKSSDSDHKIVKKEEKKPKEINYDLIKSISSTLKMVLDENKKLEEYKDIIKTQSKTVFSANTVPNISIYDYLIRIQTYANMEKSTLILGLIFIDRLCDKDGLVLTYFNIHRILFAAILVAIKCNEDSFFDNKYYSYIAGVKIDELNIIEYTFCDKIDFCLFVLEEDYIKYKQYLETF